jgi:hypothetical protein
VLLQIPVWPPFPNNNPSSSNHNNNGHRTGTTAPVVPTYNLQILSRLRLSSNPVHLIHFLGLLDA